ncbi:MAG: amino acid permease, partial [Chloroflexota bacterium]|nr:amino acid permease [Chloroflexota bacterium]
IVAMLGLIVTGLVRLALGGVEPVPPDPEAAAALRDATQYIGLFFLLNAFAQGCSALTGVEAISDGVPAFQPPESKNAARTLVWMAGLLAVMVIGTAFLARELGIVPHEGETALSMIGTAVFGRGALYQVLQWSTFLILVLAANTAYADFPRLSSIMARDKFLPGQFTFRGDRLAFTNGIVVLGILAAGLVVLYGGDEQALIPLYAVGVFLSFTLSQSGMVMRHWRLREPRWQGSILVNGIGAATTAVVLAVIIASKFTHGAWMIVVLIPLLVGLFLLIENHYREAADQLVVTSESPTTDPELDPRQIQHTILIPVGDVNRPALRAIAYARSLTGAVTHSAQEGDARIIAVHVTDDLEAAEQLKQRWQRSNAGVPLVIVESPFRSLVQPLLTYINALEGQGGSEGRLGVVTVLLPEFVPAHWWENLLHTQTALRLKGALLFRPHTVVTSVPYHLRDL